MQVVSFLLFAALFACGPRSAATTPSAQERSFDELNHDERIEFMLTSVVPAMQPIFVEQDAKRYQTFGCETCHGKAAADGQFHMPSDALPKLGGDLTKKFSRAKLDWMLTEVKPTMARLLKQKEWSPQDPYGFDCYSCHAHE